MSWYLSRRKPTPPLLIATLPPNQFKWVSASTTWSSTHTPQPPSRPIPDLETTWSNEKIVAYRTVAVMEDDGIWLGHYHPDGPSVTTLRHGNGERVDAKCEYGCSDIPGISCPSGTGNGCGWYAWKTKDQAVDVALAGRRVARVLLWGTVIEYELGYRAQYLSVDKIYETPGPDPSREVTDFGPGSIISTKGLVAMTNMLSTGIIDKDLYAKLFRPLP